MTGQPTKKFQKKKENFTCEKCGTGVIGTGFTNHCPKCLWSKHVDKNPGDREESCGGMMKPTGVEGTQAQYILLFTCEKCGSQKKNKVFPEDNFDEVLKIARTKKPGLI
jgi:Zn finger protein HypA/HybF involved in hydrogenase expression